MSNEQSIETWQVDANGQILETNFTELTTWIADGAVLRQDKVRKGNLRWIEAGKVPALIAVFNALDNGELLPGPVVTTTAFEPGTLPHTDTPTNPLPADMPGVFDPPAAEMPPAGFCSIHPDVESVYSCDTCFCQFCRACPKSYGGTVKICPMCGAMCSSIAAVQQAASAQQGQAVAEEGFGFDDFSNALAYPFRFKTSLILGAVMYMFFSLGQSAGGFGGMFMFVGAIVSYMLSNTLVFGVLSNTVNNFSQGKLDGDFMPSFDDFSIWDDVVHPFFLSIGVYISSFGPLIAVGLVAFFMVVGTVTKEMNGLQSDAAQAVSPELPYAAKVQRQSDEVKALLNKQQEAQKNRFDEIQTNVEANETAAQTGVNGPAPLALRTPASPAGPSAAPGFVKDPDDEEFDRINNMIQEQRKAQLEAAVGKTPETMAKERSALFRQILGYGALFLLLGGICLLWGLFYFPAACAVAGYTGSFAATLNPTVGLDTIRRLGFDYVKILFMTLILFIMASIVGGVFDVALSAFDMPGVGNLPAKAVASLFGFYLSVVFSCIIGFALFKGASRLKLFT
jgi:hypothetical protein